MVQIGNLFLKRVFGNCRAVSPAISTVIITAATVALVLVAWSYAYQVLERQQATAEFENVRSSVIAYDDAVRSIAWNRNASRSVEFKMTYGNLRFVPNALSLEVNASIGENTFSQTLSTGILKYSVSTAYVTFGNGYESYMVGDADQLSFSNESFSQALILQDQNFVNITLQYRIRVTAEGPTTVVQGQTITYVDIILIKLSSPTSFVNFGDFELIARNQAVNVVSSGTYEVGANSNCAISVASGEAISSANVILPQGTTHVVFNLIVGEVQVSST